MLFKQHSYNHSLYNLTYPVLVRAHAAFATNTHTFTDRFAKSVLDKLAQTTPSQTEKQKHALTHRYAALTRNDLKLNNSQKHIQQIARCEWIDKQLVNILNRHPKATGFEINAGLSTRFHRLSEQLDWPQFAWVSIDTPEVTDHKNAIFPKDDNLHTYPKKRPLIHWHHALNKHAQEPAIILIELFNDVDIAQFKQSLYALLTCNSPCNSTMHFLITHPSATNITDIIPTTTHFLTCKTLNKNNKKQSLLAYFNVIKQPKNFHTTHIFIPKKDKQ